MVTAAVVAGNDEDNNVRIDSRHREFPDERTDPLHRHCCTGDLGSINTNHIRSRKKLSADHTGGKGSLNWGIHADYIVVF